MKEVGAPWLVELYEYMSANPDIIVNGFVKSGMSKAMDRIIMPNSDEDLELQESELESDVDECEDNENEYEDSQ